MTDDAPTRILRGPSTGRALLATLQQQMDQNTRWCFHQISHSTWGFPCRYLLWRKMYIYQRWKFIFTHAVDCHRVPIFVNLTVRESVLQILHRSHTKPGNKIKVQLMSSMTRSMFPNVCCFIGLFNNTTNEVVWKGCVYTYYLALTVCLQLCIQHTFLFPEMRKVYISVR